MPADFDAVAHSYNESMPEGIFATFLHVPVRPLSCRPCGLPEFMPDQLLPAPAALARVLEVFSGAHHLGAHNAAVVART
jgi:hypothetical protein